MPNIVFEQEKKYYVLPDMIKGTQVPQEASVNYFKLTGNHNGVFNSEHKRGEEIAKAMDEAIESFGQEKL